MNIYDFKARDIDGNEIALNDYRGKVMLIVNTASKCGFTPQYEDLQKLHEKYEDQGLVILGFPCDQFDDQEFGESGEIKSFCSLNYGVSFTMFEKIKGNGKDTHPVFAYLKEQAPFKGLDQSNLTNKIIESILNEKFPSYTSGNEIRWNFTKFLVDRDGKVTERFESSVNPLEIEPSIKELL